MSIISTIHDTALKFNDNDSVLTNDTGLNSITAFATRRASNKELLPIVNKLNGRTEESKLLLSTFQHMRDSSEAHVVLVRGCAGTGKTSLVDETLRAAVANCGGMYVTGKFDQTVQQDPYFAIMEAFDDLCDLIIQSPGVAKVKNALNESLGEELEVFACLVGGVSRIIGEGNGFKAGHEFGTGQAFIRFKQQCRSFLGSVASLSQPIVLFMDDLQFADEQSIEVVLSLMESHLSNFLIIGSYRDDHVGPHDRLVQKIKKSSSERSSKFVTEIKVQNLHLDIVNDMVSSILDVDPQKTGGLSSIVMSKTLGNPFYILQYLKVLVSDGLLTFHEKSNECIWDEARVQSETDVTRNILEEIEARTKTENSDVWTLLKLAALMGFVFETDILMLVAETDWLIDCCVAFKASTSLTRTYLLSLLHIAEREGYIEKGQEGMHKWSHDEILHSFRSSIQSDQKPYLHYKIGKHFADKGMTSKTSQQFFVLEQLNMGISCVVDEDERLWLAKMNLDVGSLAISKSGFASGLQYYEKGISLLSQNTWTDQYSLTLDLFSGAAEAAHSSGNLKTAKEMVQVILDNGKSLEDKFLAFNIRINVLGAESLIDQSIVIGREMLRGMGVKIPRRPTMLHVIYEIILAKRSISNMSDKKILSLRKMDREKTMAMQILSLIIRDAYYHSHELIGVLSLRLMRLSLRYGLSEHSPLGFGMYGLICIAMGQIDEGFRFGTLSIRLLDELQANGAKARVHTFVYSGIFHFKTPICELTTKFVEGYHIGMQTGDVAFALMNGYNAGVAMLNCGRPLGETLKHFSKVHEQLAEFNEMQTLCMIRPFYQTAINLYGDSVDPVRLSGEIMEQDETIQRLKDEKNDIALIVTLVCCAEVAFFFKAWYMVEYYIDTIFLLNDVAARIENFFPSIPYKFVCALLYLRQIRITGNRKYLVGYRKTKKLMEKSAKQDVPACKVLIKLVRAEEKVSTESKDQVQVGFHDAIASLADAGYTNYVALANELAGNAMIERFSDQVTASMYYREATSNYRQWQAWGKVDQMQCNEE